ncbi:MAG: heme-copper oxidase subunit III [Flavobacteriales bacterium]
MESTIQKDTPKQDVFADYDPAVKVRTRKMMMWIIILAVVMFFGGITSFLIVLYGNLVWLHMTPPTTLWISNLLIVLSSLTLIFSIRSMRSGKTNQAFILYAMTFLLGLGFTYTQNKGWDELSARGLGSYQVAMESGVATKWKTLSYMTNEYGTDYWFEMNGERLVKENGEFYKPSQPNKPVTNEVMTTFNAFGALLSILIYVHIIHLILGLIYLLVNLFRIRKGIIHPNNVLSLQISGMYWHFMGILWVYLFFFLYYIF